MSLPLTWHFLILFAIYRNFVFESPPGDKPLILLDSLFVGTTVLSLLPYLNSGTVLSFLSCLKSWLNYFIISLAFGLRILLDTFARTGVFLKVAVGLCSPQSLLFRVVLKALEGRGMVGMYLVEEVKPDVPSGLFGVFNSYLNLGLLSRYVNWRWGFGLELPGLF